MNKTLGGYHSPVVLKAIPLEIESPVLAESSPEAKTSGIKTVGQEVEKMGFSDNVFESGFQADDWI